MTRAILLDKIEVVELRTELQGHLASPDVQRLIATLRHKILIGIEL